MTMRSYRAKYQLRSQRYIKWGCDFDKGTVKVSGVMWASFYFYYNIEKKKKKPTIFCYSSSFIFFFEDASCFLIFPENRLWHNMQIVNLSSA